MNSTFYCNLKLLVLMVILIISGLSGTCFAGQDHEHGREFNAFSLIHPLGITALTLLLLTACTGIFRRKLKKRFILIHKILAGLTVAAALSHAILVFILFR